MKRYELSSVNWGNLSTVCLFGFFLVSPCFGDKEVPSSGYREGTSHKRRGTLGFENLS